MCKIFNGYIAVDRRISVNELEEFLSTHGVSQFEYDEIGLKLPFIVNAEQRKTISEVGKYKKGSAFGKIFVRNGENGRYGFEVDGDVRAEVVDENGKTNQALFNFCSDEQSKIQRRALQIIVPVLRKSYKDWEAYQLFLR